MIVVITKHGHSPLPLAYSQTELRQVVEDFVAMEQGVFRYTDLFGYVVNRALHEGEFRTEPYTRYTSIILTEQDEHRLTMILWELIWDRRLVIEFRNNDLRQGSDTVFGIVK